MFITNENVGDRSRMEDWRSMYQVTHESLSNP